MFCYLCREYQPLCLKIYGDNDSSINDNIANILIFHFDDLKIGPEHYVCVPCWDEVKRFQKFYTRILDIHCGADSPFRAFKQTANPAGPLDDLMDALCGPVSVITRAVTPVDWVALEVKNSTENDLDDCDIKFGPYELQDPDVIPNNTDVSESDSSIKHTVVQNTDVNVAPSSTVLPLAATSPTQSTPAAVQTPKPISHVAASRKCPSPAETPNRCARITRQSLKQMNENTLLTPLKNLNSVPISKRRQTTGTSSLMHEKSRKSRRKTIDTHLTQTFKINFAADLNLAPLIIAQQNHEKTIHRTKGVVIKQPTPAAAADVTHTSSLTIRKTRRKTKENYKYNNNNNNNNTINKTISVKPTKHVCHVCGQYSKDKYSLISHVSNHTGEPAFTCEQCTYHCKTAQTIRKHMINTHNTTFTLRIK